MATNDKSLDPVLHAIDDLIEKIRTYDARDPEARRAINILEAVKTILTALCEGDGFSYYWWDGLTGKTKPSV